MKKKIVELKINGGVEMPLSVVSFVESPAIEENFMMFSKKKIEEKQEIVGICLKANKMILRVDEKNNPYYVYFTSAVVAEAMNEFSKSIGKKFNFNLEHNSKDIINDVQILNSWQVEDENSDISNKKFALGAENGDWILHLKIENKQTWDLLKERTNGFSIEIATAVFNKAVEAANDEFYDNEFCDYLISLGEDVNLDEYELVDEENIGEVELFASVPSTPNKKSTEDSGLYKLRFKYEGDISDDSRQFCKKMVAANKYYSYDNIKAAESMVVNKGFGANGTDTYDIFKFKGGVNCHHIFTKYVFFRKRENGKFLPNRGITNDNLVDDKLGVYNDSKYDNIAPVDMPNKGAYK